MTITINIHLRYSVNVAISCMCMNNKPTICNNLSGHKNPEHFLMPWMIKLFSLLYFNQDVN